jgi:hypothetical protein
MIPTTIKIAVIVIRLEEKVSFTKILSYKNKCKITEKYLDANQK